MEKLELKAVVRASSNKGAARRLRMAGMIPAVCYGRDEETIATAINPLELTKLLSGPHGPNLVFDLLIDDNGAVTRREVMVKSVQRDPVTRRFLHADFYIISHERKVIVRVPIRLEGRSVGVSMGGRLRQSARDVVLTCLPQDIPVEVVYDVTPLGLKERTQISKVTPPAGCTFIYNTDFLVAEVSPPRT